MNVTTISIYEVIRTLCNNIFSMQQYLKDKLNKVVYFYMFTLKLLILVMKFTFDTEIIVRNNIGK